MRKAFKRVVVGWALLMAAAAAGTGCGTDRPAPEEGGRTTTSSLLNRAYI